MSANEASLLWTLEKINRLVSHSGNPAETLANIVRLIQRRFETDVCSVYLLEADRSTLVLAATVGLRPESVGRVRMRLNEVWRAWSASNSSRKWSKTPHAIPDSSTSARRAKIRTTRFSECR
jgi:GAF domain-containing protein